MKRQIVRYRVDASHLGAASRAPTKSRLCPDERLGDLILQSSTRSEVLAKLELPRTSPTFRTLNNQIKRLRLDTSHFVGGDARGTGARRARWTDEELVSAVAESRSFAQTIRMLGLAPAGGNYDTVQRRVRELGLDTAHFTGAAWNTGASFRPQPVVPLDQVLVAGRATPSHRLKKRLFAAGLKSPRCERCGWDERAADGRIPVELDHINGDKTDNRLENLRILCPNCHSLQPTHRGLNQRRARSRGSSAAERRALHGWPPSDSNRHFDELKSPASASWAREPGAVAWYATL